jgi:hypothetical protein
MKRMEGYWWNDADRGGKTEEVGENPGKCLFVHHESHVD